MATAKQGMFNNRGPVDVRKVLSGTKVMKNLKNTFQITHLKSCRRTMSLTARMALAMPFMH